MLTYRIEKIVARDGKLTIQGLPFRPGEKVEIIILSHSRNRESVKGYALRGQAVRYETPHEPVAQDDWDVAK